MRSQNKERVMAEVKEGSRTKTEPAKPQSQAIEIERRPTTSLFDAGSPLAFMRRFADEMDHLYEGFGLRMPSVFGRGRELFRREAGLIPAEWSPRIDVRERDGQLLIRADLPGLSKDDVQVELADDQLTIRGERKQEKKEEREGYSYSECGYGGFFRALPLPEGVDASKVKAEFRNGVLEIAMPAPRRSETSTRRIEVQEKK
jgi:HSP20 family protein